MILSNRKTIPSSKILRSAMEEILGFKLLLTSDPEKVKGTLHLRYGNSSEVSRSVNDISPNSREFISLISNKRNFASFLEQRGFFCPSFKTNQLPKPDEYPIVIRETLTGFGGAGIHVVESESDYKQEWRKFFWTPYVNMSSEYRVHVLNGSPVKIFKKIRQEGLEDERFPIRNSGRGYRFSLRENLPGRFEKLRSLIEMLEAAFSEVGFRHCFCGLDVGFCPDKGEYFIIEGNSAPGVTEPTAKLYAQAICNSLRNR